MTQKPVMIRIALLAVALLAAAGTQAQVHKCVDAAGRVVYSQDPCPANMKSDTMSRNRPSAPAASPADSSADKAAKGDAAKNAAPKTAAEQEQAFRKRQQDQAKAAKESGQKAAEAQQKTENCRSSRERLAQFEIGGRISRINAQGERYFLEDAQIEQEKARARADVALSCN
jgi:Skp family chaperone for outer membrane proteins